MGEYCANPYAPEPKRVLDNRRETEDIFTLRLKWACEHDPGQFVQCSVPGVGEAPISISSYSDEHIELSIRRLGSVTNALASYKAGDDLLVRGPYGKGYPLKQLTGNNLILIGGGCGVAPLKGAIEYLERHRDDFANVHLFLGYRTPGDILYGHRLEEWRTRFKVELSVDKAPAEACYAGNVGFITELIERAELVSENSVAMLCGPPIMMRKSIEILSAKGFRDEQIFASAERLMFCGVGRCGHCMVHGSYTCKDGPVFRYDEVRGCGRDF